MESAISISLFFSFIIVVLCFCIDASSAQASISFTPKKLNRSGDPVHIKWSGVPSPSPLDWLGIYSPPNSRNNLFIGYVYLNSSAGYASGAGNVTIPLPILRDPYSFRIFRWSEAEINPKHLDHDHNPIPGSKHLIASSEELRYTTGRGPEQIHLALTDRGDEMRVIFLTEDKDPRYVRYGEKEGHLGRVIAAPPPVTYAIEDMCGAPANESLGWRDPGWIHDVVMNHLKNGSRYYYQVGSDSKGWSTTHSFVSKNDNSDETYAFLFGDMGTSTPYSTYHRTQDESVATMKWILRDIEALAHKPALVSHIGDISYARGFSWIWDHFFTQIEPVASKVPYHVCIGNHEYNWPSQPWRPDWSFASYGKDGGGECGVPFTLKFHMPGNSSLPTGTRAPATRNLYYSFNMGSVHFVYISTETNFLTGSSQYEFLNHDLESVDRKRTPFVVVQGHRPMYTTSNVNRDVPLMNKMREHLEPLLVKYNVTLALWGHVHRYERFCPMKNYTCGTMGQNGEPVEALPVHVVIGMAGQAWQPIWEPRETHPDDPVFPQPARSLYRGGEFGYTRLVATKEKLTFSYVGNHDGEEHDRVEFLASSGVLNGGAGPASGPVAKMESFDGSMLPKYAMGASFMVLGVFIGFVAGFMSHSKKEGASRKNWTPIKIEGGM